MDKAQHAGFLIKQISEQSDKRINNDMKRYNVTSSQFRTIMLLSSRNEVLSQKDLEVALNVSHPTVVGILTGLEEKGLVKCAFDAADKRTKNVYVTDDGRNLIRKTREGAKEMGRLLFDGIDEKEMDLLIDILEKIRENLKK